MNKTLTTILTPLASLRITVTLIVLTLLLVFAGTTAQKDFGAWDVQREYFYAWGVMAPLKYFAPLTSWSETLGGKVPLVGGYTIALAMLLNLGAAHIVRFKVTWRDLLVIPPLVALIWFSGYMTAELGYYVLSAVLLLAALPLIGSMYWLHGKRGGVHLIHLGLILMLGGELATNAVKIEQVMPIDEGGYANYAFDTRYAEFAVIDSSSPDHNKVTVIEEDRLKAGGTIKHKDLPFTVKIDAFYPNSALISPADAKPTSIPPATAGFGLQVVAESRPKADGLGKAPQDVPAAYVSLTSASGHDLGRYMVSEHLAKKQEVTVDGKTYEIALRWPRYYKPFQLHLKDFRFDRHTGTDMARNYSSLVRLVDPQRGEDREVKIWMNHPLRYNGETFYQSSFDNVTETRTFLQVVRNPSWLFPYIACVVGGLGMLAHFSANLLNFSRKRAAMTAADAGAVAPAGGKKQRQQQYTLPPRHGLAYRLVPAGVLAFCVIYLISILSPRPLKTESGIDLKAASAIPMNYEGRVLPLDTFTRVSLKVITGGKEDLRRVVDENPPAGMQVLFDAFTRNPRTPEYKIFKIDNPEVVGFMGLDPINPKDGTERHFFSIAEMQPKLQQLDAEATKIHNVDDKVKTAFQREISELYTQVIAFGRMSSLMSLHLTPPAAGSDEWRRVGDALPATDADVPEPAVAMLRDVVQAYGNDDAAAFDKAVATYTAHLQTVAPKEMSKARAEVFFNRVSPFYHLMSFYVLAFVLVLMSFLFATAPLRRAAMWVLLLTVVVHTGGLIFRMYLQGRPPVTTLYSSAIFIAWGGAILALVLEWFFKNGVGLLVAAVVGFCSLFVAHNLSLTDGDSLRELQAVLDTNFWLATHVVMIVLGYASTFLAGILAIFYVIRGVFTTTLDKDAGKELLRMVYGILCFAMLFSFVGTVLGGIWADQSWGRFWGWDPKENGAILIVLWNALILHARWGGLVKERGVMVLAIFGNVVTAWSYFGTNELGIGLHAYGFTEGRRFWLFMFAVSQMAIMCMGLLPATWWRSDVMATAQAGRGFPINPKTTSPSGAVGLGTN